MATPAEGTPEAVTEQPAPAAETPAASADAAAAGDATAEKPAKVPLTAEEKAKAKAERAERRKLQRKAARALVKEARARGEPVEKKPRAPKAEKAKASGEVTAPEGSAPKISVAKLPESVNSAELASIFAPYGQILRAEVSKRRGRPTIGTITFNTHAEVRKAVAALNGKHKFSGESEPINIQYAKDASELGELVKKTTDEVADCLKQFNYKPSLLRNKGTKDFINRAILMRKKAPPPKEVLTAALLVSAEQATVDDLVKATVVESAAPVQQLLREDKDRVKEIAKTEASKVVATQQRGEDSKPAIKIEKTFDAVIPRLDKLEKERWNRMAKANIRLSERYRFRFVDILATPSLELWRWMVEDCDLTSAEAGTCFAILQAHYGFTK